MSEATEVRTARLSDAQREAIRFSTHIVVPDKIGVVLDAWLDMEVQRAQRTRSEKDGRIERWRKTLSGRNPNPVQKRGAANISVPLTMWARTGVRARVDQGVWEASPIISVTPFKGRDSEDAPSNATAAKALQNLLIAEVLNPRGLNGRAAMGRTQAELIDLGTSGLKVAPTPARYRRFPPREVGADPECRVIPGRVTWEYISRQDLLWVEGYGTDTQEMPFIGHEFDQPWGEIVAYGEEGHYDKSAIDAVEVFYKKNQGDRPAAVRDHRLAELYLDYDVDDDGYTEAVLITWHIEARRRMRTIWTPIPSGRRPIVMGNFDLPADLTSADGQGLCEKTEGVQDETDAVHNIAIEAGKRGAAHVLVVKEGTRAEEEFGGEDDIMPGDVIVTAAPDEDIKVVPLGDPQAALAGLQIEDHSRMYLMRMFGFDESRLGNLESGKRVSAQVGMTTIREGRVIIRQVLGSIRDMMTEAAYLTIELWKTRLPAATIAAVLTPEEANLLSTSVFSLSETSLRSQFLVTVNAEDAATVEETKKNELMAINQFLFTFYDRLTQLVITLANPQIPPSAKAPLVMIAERMERGVEALLNTLDTIPNPDELLVSVARMRGMLEEVSASAAAAATGAPTSGAPSVAGTDLGGGVA